VGVPSLTWRQRISASDEVISLYIIRSRWCAFKQLLVGNNSRPKRSS